MKTLGKIGSLVINNNLAIHGDLNDVASYVITTTMTLQIVQLHKKDGHIELD